MKSEEMNTEISEIGVPSPDLSDLGGELEKKSLMKEKSSAPGELEIKLKEIAEEITKELEEKREGAYDEYSIMLKTTLEQKMEPIPFTAGPEIKNITERIDRIDEELRMVRKEVENTTERIDRIENDLTEHIYKPLVKGIGISTALLGILFAVTSSILAIPVFIISYLCFWGLWKSKKS